jgi:hypothetical protein
VTEKGLLEREGSIGAETGVVQVVEALSGVGGGEAIQAFHFDDE